MNHPNEIKEPEFRIPDGYFNELNRRVEARIAGARKTRGHSLKFYILRSSATAAVVAAIILCAHFFSREDTPTLSQSSDKVVITGEEARQFAKEYVAAATGYTPAQNIPSSQSETLDEIILANDLSIVYSDRGSTYAIDPAAAEQYIIDNYNIMELASL